MAWQWILAAYIAAIGTVISIQLRRQNALTEQLLTLLRERQEPNLVIEADE